jgi:hypothetical protein
MLPSSSHELGQSRVRTHSAQSTTIAGVRCPRRSQIAEGPLGIWSVPSLPRGTCSMKCSMPVLALLQRAAAIVLRRGAEPRAWLISFGRPTTLRPLRNPLEREPEGCPAQLGKLNSSGWSRWGGSIKRGHEGPGMPGRTHLRGRSGQRPRRHGNDPSIRNGHNSAGRPLLPGWFF